MAVLHPPRLRLCILCMHMILRASLLRVFLFPSRRRPAWCSKRCCRLRPQATVRSIVRHAKSRSAARPGNYCSFLLEWLGEHVASVWPAASFATIWRTAALTLGTLLVASISQRAGPRHLRARFATFVVRPLYHEALNLLPRAVARSKAISVGKAR